MSQTNEIVISAKGLQKNFGDVTAVAGIDFSIARGECVGILGPNGAGKSTTINMMLGLSEPTAGQLSILGYDLPRHAKALRHHVGVVPQQDNLDPELNVIENLQIFARYFGLRSADINPYLLTLLADMSLEGYANKRIRTLSGGMQRRLSLARALINKPQIVFLDEPTTGLDPQARQRLWQRVRQERNAGTTVVLTTHYLEEAERLCDRVIMIDQGHILASDTPKVLIAQHIEPHVFEIFTDEHAEFLTAELPALRTELLGDSVLCYTDKEPVMLAYLEQQDRPLEFTHRRGNLEDVFLKLTGRELRDV